MTKRVLSRRDFLASLGAGAAAAAAAVASGGAATTTPAGGEARLTLEDRLQRRGVTREIFDDVAAALDREGRKMIKLPDGRVDFEGARSARESHDALRQYAEAGHPGFYTLVRPVELYGNPVHIRTILIARRNEERRVGFGYLQTFRLPRERDADGMYPVQATQYFFYGLESIQRVTFVLRATIRTRDLEKLRAEISGGLSDKQVLEPKEGEIGILTPDNIRSRDGRCWSMGTGEYPRYRAHLYNTVGALYEEVLQPPRPGENPVDKNSVPPTK